MLKEVLQSEIWSTEYFSNTVLEYVVFCFLFLFLILGFFILKKFLLQKVEEKIKQQKIISFLIESLDQISFFFYGTVSLYVSSFALQLPEIAENGLYFIVLIWTSYYVLTSLGSRFIDLLSDLYIEAKGKEEDDPIIRMLRRIAKALLWIAVALVIMSSLGINITALVAGMGVGGIAIAFALQQILGDLFSSFSIYFDKPFLEGDFIIVDDKMGVVEKIGIKSTRVRALQGEEIIFSNKDLTSKQVHNFGNMDNRRTDITVGITYETPSKKMQKIPKMIKKIVEKEELAEFDRVHFSSFGDFSLNYEIIYFVKSADYLDFMNTKEKILLNIKKEFEKEGIDFAYPTNTIYLSKS